MSNSSPNERLLLSLGLPVDMKVRDAKLPLRVTVAACDRDTAIQGHPRSCVIAQAVRRMYGSDKIPVPAVAIFRRVGYVETIEKGEHVLARFMVDAEANRALKHFDKTGRFPESADYISLKVIPGSWTTEHRRAAKGTGKPKGPLHRKQKTGKPYLLRQHARQFMAA